MSYDFIILESKSLESKSLFVAPAFGKENGIVSVKSCWKWLFRKHFDNVLVIKGIYGFIRVNVYAIKKNNKKISETKVLIEKRTF